MTAKQSIIYALILIVGLVVQAYALKIGLGAIADIDISATEGIIIVAGVNAFFSLRKLVAVSMGSAS